ncbi:heavy metal transporter CzcB [Streptacidiphilus sp. PAMC 29251]
MHRRSFLAAGVSALTLPAPGTGRAVGAAAELVRALMPGWTATQTQAVHYAGPEPRVLAARALFCTARYRELDATLPALIIDLRAASADGRDDARLSRMLATAYQLAASTLLKRNDVGSAWLAVGRAVAEGERSADPVTLASSVRLQGHALTREGHTGAAVAAIRHTADQLTGSYDHRSTDYLAALGLLLLRGVTAASRGGDRAAVKDFLNEATDVARYVQVDRPDSWANFSTTNLTLHAVSAHVAFGDAGTALQQAAPLMRCRIPAPNAAPPCGWTWPAPTPSSATSRRLITPCAWPSMLLRRTCAAPQCVISSPTSPPVTAPVGCPN